jgi:hypothetical protein
MAKRQQQDSAKMQSGRNNPRKSTEITTGTPKKRKTFREQVYEHKNPHKQAQAASAPTAWNPKMGLTHKGDSRARMSDRTRRAGSESNAHKHRKDNAMTPDHKQPHGPEQGDGFAHDLQVAHHAASDLGMGDAATPGLGYQAEDIKELHTRLADLTDNDMKNLLILPTGTRLEQGAKYIDLEHLERGEFVATGPIIAEPGHYYVAKKDTNYILWNRLNQVEDPKRLDE